MTKFEEELFNKVPCKFELTTEAEYKKSTLINHFKNWHSDEEFQELLEQNAELTRENNIVNQINSKLESQIIDLKSQLQHQALPVVPECVDMTIKQIKNDQLSLYGALNAILSDVTTEIYAWISKGNQNAFALAFITGKYEVEKPQLFRLKLKNAPISNYYLWLNQATGKVFVDKKFLDWTNHDNVKNIFTKQEIAKISDGAFVNNEAFELMPVEDGE